MKITVVGAGYVGLSNAVLVARQHTVCVLDIDAQKVSDLRQGRLPISDPYMATFVKENTLNISFTTEEAAAFQDADLIIVATPTDYEVGSGCFDTSSVERTIATAACMSPKALIAIRSTVPVGFTNQLRLRYGSNQIVFCPEFLREGSAMWDCLNPSRIVVGGSDQECQRFADVFLEAVDHKEVPVLITGASEAEAIKLFSNTYLAMRVAFFNELDTFAATRDFDSGALIKGVCLDERIGDYYNNPSFGYGGYCLPKDTRQMLTNYESVPQNLIKAIVESNDTRKDFIAQQILECEPGVVGVYRVVMKANSDNFRSSSIVDVMHRLVERGVELLVYEPLLKAEGLSLFSFPAERVRLVDSLSSLKKEADLIIANRLTEELSDVMHKVYSRDQFYGDL